MIKVFLTAKIVYLINDCKFFKAQTNRALETINTADEMRLKYNELIIKSNSKLEEVYFFNSDAIILYEYFAAMFKIINAAGGLVQNNKQEWLFIFRNGKWDLPKGKIEKNEKIKTAAMREVEEECGIKGLTIIEELPSTYHVYLLEGKAILKRTYWFKMSCTDTATLVPQLEEGITDVKWFPKNKFSTILANTYDSVKDVISCE